MKVKLAFYGAALCLCLTPLVLAQDVVKTDSAHYTVISENSQVRILNAHYGPGEKSNRHSHPASVIVFLTDSKEEITTPDGKKQDAVHKAGDAVYQPATTHEVQNAGDTESNAVMIELKGKSHKNAKLIPAQDAVKTDPAHYTVISDNDQVRILKVHYGPHEKSPVMHSHPATAVVFLTDANGHFNLPDGKTQDFTAKAGGAQYNDATTHQPENTGDTDMEAVVVELKR